MESGERERLVDYYDIYVTEYQMDSYSYGYTTSTSFDGENQITSAIHYVISEDLPVVYALTGHGEMELSESMTAQMENENYTLEELHLLSVDAIPEDADCVLIYAPASDLGDDEADMLIDWLDAGGNLILLTDFIEADTMSNLLRVASHMGLTAGDGMVLEGDRNGYWNLPYYLLPDLESHEITDPLISGRYYVLVPCAQPIETVTDAGAEVEFLLTTSDFAYAKSEGYDMESFEQDDGDAAGPFHIAAAASLGEARMVWIASASLLSTDIDRMSSGANGNFFLNALGWMCGQEETISIRAKSLDANTLTVTAQESSMWSTVLIGIVPAAFVLVGIVVWYRRKKR